VLWRGSILRRGNVGNWLVRKPGTWREYLKARFFNTITSVVLSEDYFLPTFFLVKKSCKKYAASEKLAKN